MSAHAPFFGRTSRRGRFRRAFTVIELLVAIGITALMAGFAIAIVGHVSGFWSRTSGRVSAEAQARYIFDRLALDLDGAIFRDDGGVWFAASVPADTANSGLWDTRGAHAALLKPSMATGTTLVYHSAAGIAGDTFGAAGTWLRFFTTSRGRNKDLATLSAPVAVAWQIIRRASSSNPNGTDRRYFLHRAEVRAVQAGARPGTLEAGFDITAAAYADISTGPLNTGALGDPCSVRAPQDPGTIVGENVIDFGVRCYVRDRASGVLRQIFPVAGETSHLASVPPAVGVATAQFPEVVDVLVRILSDEGGRLIADLEAGRLGTTPPNGVTAAAWWWQLALAHSHVFTRRIVLIAEPL
jgi:hypothetical protein